MQPLITPSIRLKNGSEISAALRRASIVTGKIPADLANRFALSVGIRARKKLPAVDTATIRAELAKTAQFNRTTPGKTAPSEAPFIAALVQARVNPGSHFNQATNRRFTLAQSPFAGGHFETVAGHRRWDSATRTAMRDAMRRMIAARIRARGFFRLCATIVTTIFRTSGNKTKTPVPTESLTSQKFSARIGKIAGGTIATGNGKANAKFWVGEALSTQDNSLFGIAGPIWNQAIADETKSLNDNTAKREYAAALKLAGFKVQ